MMADGSLLRSGGETWGPVSPENVHETGISPGDSLDPASWPRRRSRSGDSKKDLVTRPIRGFCALQVTGRQIKEKASVPAGFAL
jgi:hypothetical protein